MHLETLCCRFAVLLAIAATSAAADDMPPPGRPADHVVLVSIDGLRPEFYLDRTWPAPMLQQLRAQGAHAEAVRTVFPSVTYPAHATMLTGVVPARHGIYYNSPFEPGGQTGRWYWEASAIRAKTLWDAAREAGLATASLNWPVSVGAPVDFNVPEVWSLDRGADPIEVFRRAEQPPGFLAELEREATGKLRPGNFTIDHITRDDRAGDMAAYLLETYRPALMTVHLAAADHFQHDDGRDSPRVRRALAAADRALSQIYEAAERAGILARTAFVVTGDHGFVDVHTRLAPNVWLVEAGLRSAADDRGDWRATFHTTAASAFLHLAEPDDHEALERVRQVLAELPVGVRRGFRVVERDELDRLGAAPEAVLAFAMQPGFNVTSSARGPAVRPDHGGQHGFMPDFPHIRTGFVAAGAGIRAGAVAPRLELVDVAPLVAHLLALDLPPGDGLLPLGFLAESPLP
ncbi:MAG: ectonucleotide pyrophosphatase/phosphodiesterase [Thermoanaerobaculia bacterium]